MKLLYAYFDFTSQYDNSSAFKSIGQCSLNLSTTHDYSVNKQPHYPNRDKMIRYSLVQEEKPTEDRIPEGFWGDRIYNVTALVGANGTGKTTLIIV